MLVAAVAMALCGSSVLASQSATPDSLLDCRASSCAAASSSDRLLLAGCGGGCGWVRWLRCATSVRFLADAGSSAAAAAQLDRTSWKPDRPGPTSSSDSE